MGAKARKLREHAANATDKGALTKASTLGTGSQHLNSFSTPFFFSKFWSSCKPFKLLLIGKFPILWSGDLDRNVFI
jgi:hypothetical protein